VASMAESLRDLCRVELGYAPKLYFHPALPECIILPPKLNRDLACWWEPLCQCAGCLLESAVDRCAPAYGTTCQKIWSKISYSSGCYASITNMYVQV
jgi:hypothetical protein